MAGCRTDCVEKPFSIGFQKFGRFVGRHPWWFFIGPLVISTALGTGFYFLEDMEANNIEDQFTPVNGPAKLERKFVEENFPLNNSVYSNQRLYTMGEFASFIAVSRAPNIFTDGAIKEILSLDKKSLNFITVTHSTSLSRQVEFEANTRDVIPLFSITYVIAIVFSIVSCLRFDCVRNKVWVATFGVLSAGLAVLSAFGMMLHIGVPFVMTVANSPFLILGIGVDDMFILISCWQQTNVHARVEDRLADTYKEAAISITITTLTDVLAFYIGLMTPFRSVQSFCLYTSTAILFCFLYSITFFGAFLVLNGRRENSNKHWLTCKEVPEDCPVGRSKWYNLCCVGGAYDRHTGAEEVQPMNHFFKKHYGPFLVKPWTKVCVILLYSVYLTISIYGCFQIQEGIDLRNLAADDSYVNRSKVNQLKGEAWYLSSTGSCHARQDKTRTDMVHGRLC
ncbi:hypothetical protein J4Q44_G00298240 [Coregonus suidteri]|uniref:SSD domain-containing protein n=1 Tax=Coregonus suidteri TaxID=861788 RepID=A0AAN8L905_9TELE